VGVLDGRIAYLAVIPFAVAVILVRPGWRRTALWLVAAGHLTVLASVALFPLPLSPQLVAEGRYAEAAGWAGSSLNLVPFATVGPVLAGRTDAVAREIALLNLFVLTPAGIYLPLLFPRLRSWAAFAPFLIAGGLAIEAFQLAISLAIGFRYRSIDIDDVILNTLGLAVGWLAATIVLGAFVKRGVRRRASL
jgi:glycopeptide antibiotics resistance protein